MLSTARCGRFEPVDSQKFQGLSVVENNYFETIYPIFRSQCASCHSIGQEPFFATGDVRDSFEIVQKRQLIDLTQPANSRVIQVVRGGRHHGVRDFVADNLLAAISEYTYNLSQ